MEHLTNSIVILVCTLICDTKWTKTDAMSGIAHLCYQHYIFLTKSTKWTKQCSLPASSLFTLAISKHVAAHPCKSSFPYNHLWHLIVSIILIKQFCHTNPPNYFSRISLLQFSTVCVMIKSLSEIRKRTC